ncbi:hypothetical protein DL96DRAFT_1819111 [Flagelloscypha sp. PMI_526]|nr:hypothetical protein DL96DRAFT_1819111 [Flagelloscypha sp. PMI_526]
MKRTESTLPFDVGFPSHTMEFWGNGTEYTFHFKTAFDVSLFLEPFRPTSRNLADATQNVNLIIQSFLPRLLGKGNYAVQIDQPTLI